MPKLDWVADPTRMPSCMKIVTQEGNRVAFAVHIEVPEKILTDISNGKPVATPLPIWVDCLGLDEFVAMRLNPEVVIEEIAIRIRDWFKQANASTFPERKS